MTDPTAQDPFEVPEGYTGDIGNPLEGENVQLPYLAPFVYWANGKIVHKLEGGPRFFGAWGMNDADMGTMLQQSGMGTPPPGWTPYDQVNEQTGNPYTSFMCRYIYVAIFGSRFAWLKDKKNPNDKGKGHYQVLGYMAYPEATTKEMIPFGPVVLTCKSMASKYLKKAVVKFATDTQSARMKFANNLPISAFYSCFGTFGDQRVEEEVGQGNNRKKITPLRLWLPEQIDEPFLRRMFVGKEIAARTATLRKMSTEWLEDWKRYAQDEEQPQGNGSGAQRPVPQPDLVEDHMPPEPPEYDDEMPS